MILAPKNNHSLILQYTIKHQKSNQNQYFKSIFIHMWKTLTASLLWKGRLGPETSAFFLLKCLLCQASEVSGHICMRDIYLPLFLWLFDWIFEILLTMMYFFRFIYPIKRKYARLMIQHDVKVMLLVFVFMFCKRKKKWKRLCAGFYCLFISAWSFEIPL